MRASKHSRREPAFVGSALKLAVPADSVFTNIYRGSYSVNAIYTLGTTSDLPRMSKAAVKEGRFFNELESRAGWNVVVLGFDVAAARARVEQAKRELGAKGLLVNGEIPELRFDLSDDASHMRMAEFAKLFAKVEAGK